MKPDLHWYFRQQNKLERLEKNGIVCIFEIPVALNHATGGRVIIMRYQKTSQSLFNWGIKLLFCSTILLNACNSHKNELKTGAWRGVLHIQDQRLPFNFEINRQGEGLFQVVLINAEERLEIDSVPYTGDSLEIPMYVFDAVIKAKNEGNTLSGLWIKPYAEDYRIPFEAEHDEKRRFIPDQKPAQTDITGKWEAAFTTQQDTTQAIGIFRQSGNELAGTFMTATGDYRFLEGVVSGDSLYLSGFNGTDAYLFKAAITDDLINGAFYSGKTGFRRWRAKRNENAQLPDPNQLTDLKPGYETVDFAFPDLTGKVVSLDNKVFRNKPVIIQIMGSWCRNCMDETRFLASWRRENSDLPVEIVALAFERKNDMAYARKQLTRYIDRFDITYPILFAGSKEKADVMRALPMIDVRAFPTTIFLDRDKRVRKIHTGFSGPGTGEYYEEFVEEFNETVKKLAADEVF